MASNWEVIKLNDFVNIKTGFPFKSKQYLEHGEGYKLLRGDNVIQGAFRWENVKLWSEDELTEKQKDYFLENGDVILAMDRPWIEAGLKTAQITNRDLPCLLVQRVARLQAKNSEDQDFLRYLISSYWFVEYLKLVQTGTAIPHISTKQILSYETKIPPLEERKKIGSLLRSLDDKIELNLQMNETLEAMAQALFKSWFVDFDPVIDNALAAGNTIPDEFIERAEQRKAIEKKDNSNIQDLFPNEFEFTEEMGWIPKGWRISPLTEVIDFLEGPGIRNWQYTEEEDGIKFINIRCIQDGDIKLATANKITKEEAFGKYEHFQLEVDDIVVSASGTLGRYAFVRKEHLPLSLNTSVIRFRPIEGISTLYYIAGYIDTKLQFELETRATGSAQRNFGPMHLKQISMLLPPINILEKHLELAKRLFSKRKSSLEQVETLTKLRDTLLPKLMSGELRIADAEALVEHV